MAASKDSQSREVSASEVPPGEAVSRKGCEPERDAGKQSGRRADVCLHAHTHRQSLVKESYSLPTTGAILSTLRALSHSILKVILWVGYCYFSCFTDEEGKARRGEATCQSSEEARKQKSQGLSGNSPAPSACPTCITALRPSPGSVAAHFWRALELSLPRTARESKALQVPRSHSGE